MNETGDHGDAQNGYWPGLGAEARGYSWSANVAQPFLGTVMSSGTTANYINASSVVGANSNQ